MYRLCTELRTRVSESVICVIVWFVWLCILSGLSQDSHWPWNGEQNLKWKSTFLCSVLYFSLLYLRLSFKVKNNTKSQHQAIRIELGLIDSSSFTEPRVEMAKPAEIYWIFFRALRLHWCWVCLLIFLSALLLSFTFFSSFTQQGTTQHVFIRDKARVWRIQHAHVSVKGFKNNSTICTNSFQMEVNFIIRDVSHLSSLIFLSFHHFRSSTEHLLPQTPAIQPVNIHQLTHFTLLADVYSISPFLSPDLPSSCNLSYDH